MSAVVDTFATDAATYSRRARVVFSGRRHVRTAMLLRDMHVRLVSCIAFVHQNATRFSHEQLVEIEKIGANVVVQLRA